MVSPFERTKAERNENLDEDALSSSLLITSYLVKAAW